MPSEILYFNFDHKIIKENRAQTGRSPSTTINHFTLALVTLSRRSRCRSQRTATCDVTHTRDTQNNTERHTTLGTRGGAQSLRCALPCKVAVNILNATFCDGSRRRSAMCAMCVKMCVVRACRTSETEIAPCRVFV